MLKKLLSIVTSLMIFFGMTGIPIYAERNFETQIWKDKYGTEFFIPGIARFKEFPTKDGLELFKSSELQVYLKTMKPGMKIKDAVKQLLPNYDYIGVGETYIGEDYIMIESYGIDSYGNTVTLTASALINDKDKSNVNENTRFQKFTAVKTIGRLDVLEPEELFNFIDIATGWSEYYGLEIIEGSEGDPPIDADGYNEGYIY